MELSKWINPRFLPIKLHYILFFGGQSAILPFLPIIAKQLGISATALGLTYSVLPFVAFVTVPFLCSLADKYNAIRLVLMIAVLMTGVSYSGIAFLSPIGKHFASVAAELSCTSIGSTLTIEGTQILNGSCVSRENVTCYCSFTTCDGPESSQHDDALSCNASGLSLTLTVRDNIKIQSMSEGENTYATSCNEAGIKVQCDLTCDTVHPCLELGEAILDKNVYKSHQFWVFLVLMVSSWVFAATVMSLADSLCYQLLNSQDEASSYGKQRLWGTIGWGGFGSLMGYWFNTTKDKDDVVDYTIGFIFMASMYTLDLIVLYFMQPKTVTIKSHEEYEGPKLNLGQTLLAILRKPPIAVFIVEVLVMGLLTGLMWSFSFWYFEDIGANHTIMGLVMAVQCFLGELPFFFFSDVIIKFCGHFLTVSICFMAYGLRYVIYAYIANPWIILPAEILHGPAYSLFYSTMTSYAQKVAPIGSEASVQGIMAGTFENLGAATAGLIGGIAMDKYGGRKTFLTSGFAAAACCTIYVILHYLYLKRKNGFKEKK